MKIAATFLSILFLVFGTISVYAENETASTVPLAASARVTITNFAFVPPKVTITAGSSVTWTNTDNVAHTSTSDAAGWDSGHIAGGQTYTLRFNAPGTYTYHCNVHPGMKGTVVVQ